MRLRPTRLLAIAAMVLVAALYWKPLHTYAHAHSVLQHRQADVARLERQQQVLRARIASAGTGEDFVREARRLGYVKPGERLFIVHGIGAWRNKTASHRDE